ncbi:iron-sulfur cluster repair di-iron protein [Chondrinema litorale]|uniref:iron-sulfur cluster repair di-iron protein n=1 Tax=Chondrinema litorale TaxID=2994555 RepID=UPI002542771A|nr:iron-sulfur cluster repair di-iron protein [Chondrinema litorale]UZR93615.1 iron-sulfur cluster repair di-iron protein [Chondrinema litorale]
MSIRNPDTYIKDLVAQNHHFASVLHFFGISFYRYPDNSLEEVCKIKGLDIQVVLNSLKNVLDKETTENQSALKDLPIEVILSYLKKTHKSFIRQKLPFISDMIKNISPEYFDLPDIAKDLKFIFPLFVEDFIKHIYEEEKIHFGYIERLNHALNFDINAYTLFNDLRENSITKILIEHKEEDDEMKGIRDLTNNYFLQEDSGLYTRTVYLELKNFEEDLKKHAYIENEILYPKAKGIEIKVSKRLHSFAKLN